MHGSAVHGSTSETSNDRFDPAVIFVSLGRILIVPLAVYVLIDQPAVNGAFFVSRAG